ncbi:MAG: alpha/beta hydrolase [Hyphomicrobiales bacterium]|nr:MAG: alpha/beta hydrolase [Hyphomicrobiales bacterium]
MVDLDLNKTIQSVNDASTQVFIKTKEDTKISFRQWGEAGPILVMLHGGYGSWMHWLNNVCELCKNFRIVVPDMPGFGESELLPYLPSLDQYAQILVDALDELLPEEQYSLVGFSFGSAIGSHMMKFAGDKVKRLTLVGYNRTGNMPFKRPKMKSWRDVSSKEELFAAQRFNLSVMMLHKEEKIDDLAITVQTLNTRGGKVRSLDIVATHDLPSRLLEVNKPIDIIWGEFDVTLINGIDNAQERMQELIPDVECHVINNTGHWVQFEEPEQFNKIINKIYN